MLIPAIDDNLRRSGLALAGFNKRKSAGGNDGVLTAYEVSSLNLWETKLVVLSACETGLGGLLDGEGVFGLRRALVLLDIGENYDQRAPKRSKICPLLADFGNTTPTQATILFFQPGTLVCCFLLSSATLAGF